MGRTFEDLTVTWTGERLYIHEQDGSGVEWLADSPEEVGRLLTEYIEMMEGQL